MKAGAAGMQPAHAGCIENTATRVVDGRLREIDEIRMQSEPCLPRAVLVYARGCAAKNAPKIAISLNRPSDTQKRPYCLFLAFLSHLHIRKTVFECVCPKVSTKSRCLPACRRTVWQGTSGIPSETPPPGQARCGPRFVRRGPLPSVCPCPRGRDRPRDRPRSRP
jgi:hypothetical protein